MRRVLVLALLCGCSSEISTPASGGYPFSAGKADDGAALPVPLDLPEERWFEQSIEHPRGATGTFSQRYWYTTQYAENANSPVLFFLCGEAACDPWYATVLADSAKALKASIVVLEHRYYGLSVPYPDESLEHMKYLTIHNALEDAAAFQTWAMGNLPLAGKWIAVGGSYPGMLAAFYREVHPELAAGAWASSAPVDVSLSFWGYDTIATRALGEECASLFRIALGTAEDIYGDDTLRDPVATALLGGTPATLADFLNDISFFAEGAAQYGTQAVFCAHLTAHRDRPWDGVTEYVQAQGTQPLPRRPLPPGKVTPILRAPEDGTSFQGSEWLYQVCTEVGFYQTHSLDQGNTIMSWLIDEDYWAAQCQALTGGAPAIDRTRASYVDALTNGQVSNLFFVNGSLDPWSALSFTSTELAPAGVTVAVINNGSHCSDLANLSPSSPDDVFAAHKQFYELARGWLAQ